MTLFQKATSLSQVKPSQFKHFSSGIPPLDEYLKRYAKRNERKNLSRTFVFLHENDVVAYYTVNATEILFDTLPESLKKGFPKYPLPAVRLCRLAVDQTFQGKGLGKHLLMDAIDRTINVAKEIAVFALIVDAKNVKARHFYLKYDFIPFEKESLRLFLPLSTLLKT